MAQRLERRAAKKARGPNDVVDDPMNDPTIDWGDAVREIEIKDPELDAMEGTAEQSA